MKKSLLLLNFLASAVIAALATGARAGIAVSPLKQEISLRPGESGKLTITLSDVARDPQAEPQPLHLDITDVLVSEAGSLALPDASTQANSASKWITLPETDLTLSPGKAEPLQVTITPPLNTPPGEYYSAVLVTLGRKGKSDKGIIVQYRIASGIFVTVQGRTLSKQAKIERSEFTWPAGNQTASSADGPPDLRPMLSVVLANTGKGRFDGSGKLRIFDKESHLVYKTALTSNRPCVFAGDSRLFEATLSKPLVPGNYLARIDMDYQSSWSTAHVDLPFDVSPEQASVWMHASKHSFDDNAVVEAGLDKITVTVYPGSSRNFAVPLRNVSDTAVHATAAATGENRTLPDSWLVLAGEEFAIGKAGRRSVPIGLQIPVDAKPGNYSTQLIIHAGPEGQPMAQEMSIPIDLEVKAERQ